MSSMYLNICREGVKRMDSGAFSVVPCDRERGNGHKLNTRKHFFMRMTWHIFPGEMVESPSLEIFKSHL